MKNITYINASAGSGKTYTLTQKLADLVASKKIKASEAILTTFSKRSAEELKERAQKVFCEKGLYSEISDLEQSLIGTVHSVANSIICKYWYYLGLSPQMGVLSEEDVEFYRNQSLAYLPTEEELKFLSDFSFQFEAQDMWQKHLKSVVDASTSYLISDFKDSESYSIQMLKDIYTPSTDFKADMVLYEKILNEIKSRIQGKKTSTDADIKRLQKISQFMATKTSKTVAWLYDLYCFLEKLPKEYKTPLWNQAVVQLEPVLRDKSTLYMQEEYVRLIFNLALRWREQFAKYKKERQLLDYNDMEKYFLELLENPQVLTELKTKYKYLFVDEFQDSSPIQVKIFEKLSEIAEQNIWVGDTKQAIYGFRGSDTALTKSVSEIIASGGNGNSTEILAKSYRSLTNLVESSNVLFTKLFYPLIKPENVMLGVGRDDKELGTLKYWILPKQTGFLPALAAHVAKISKDKPANQIAVLGRTNDKLNELADILTNDFHLPVCKESGSLLDYQETELLIAILSLLVDKKNGLAKAKIAYLVEEDYPLNKILETKLALSKEDTTWLNEVPMIASLLSKHESFRKQSIGALIPSIIAELDLINWATRNTISSQRIANFNKLCEVATQYEQHCLQLGIGATIVGFISYLKDSKFPIAQDSSGIQLVTYHGAKGLQWDTVIMTSLEDDPLDENETIAKDFYGVHTILNDKITPENLYPKRTILLLPWVFGTKKIPQEIIASNIKAHPVFKTILQNKKEESTRLLYVGYTRAQNNLILAIKSTINKTQKTETSDGLSWFKVLGTNINNPNNAACDLLSTGYYFAYEPEVTSEELESLVATENTPTIYPIAGEPKTFALRDRQPSNQKGISSVKMMESNKNRIKVYAKTDEMQQIGNCIHQIFCIMDTNPSDAEIIRIVKDYKLEKNILNPLEIRSAWLQITNYLQRTYGNAVKTYHERELKYLEDGQIFTGNMDYVWQTEKGCVLVDFKTYPGSDSSILDEQDKHYAGNYAGQFNCYTKALEKSGEKVLDKIVFYPVSSTIVKLGE